MASSLSEITDICPESDRYMEKSLCTWYDMHDPGAGYKCYWVTEVRYLGSGSEDKALRRWTERRLRNMEGTGYGCNFPVIIINPLIFVVFV